MSKTLFYIFRHGETDWNKNKRIQGHTNTSLNELGKIQAKSLVDILEDKEIEIIYSSDLDRAVETAKIVNQKLNVEIITTHNLREAHFGEAEGLHLEEIIEKWGQDLWDRFKQVGKYNHDIAFPGGETRGESIIRMRSVIEQIVNEKKYSKVGISTHGGVVRNLLHSFLPENHSPLPIHNCVCYLLEFEHKSGLWSVKGPLNSGIDFF